MQTPRTSSCSACSPGWPPARCAGPRSSRAQLIIAVYSSENACAVNMSIGAVLKCAAALSVIWKYMYYASSEAFMQRSLLFCSIGLGSQRPRRRKPSSREDVYACERNFFSFIPRWQPLISSILFNNGTQKILSKF